MTEFPWLMFILIFISTVQWPNSIAEHIYDNNSHWERNVGSSTKNIPKGTSLVNRDNRTTTTTSIYKEDQRIEPVTSNKSIKVIILPTANLTNSSSIIFPNSTDEKIKIISINKFIPDQSVIDKCSLNESFCIKVDNYPREDLLNLFRTSKFMSTTYYDIDAVNEINEFETRIADTQFQSFCQSKTDVIFPEVGITIENGWRYIIQDPSNDKGSFKQGIRVEKCIDAGVPCNFDDTLPIGYYSICVQKYVYKRLISINGSQEFYYDSFKIPSCCECMYSINEDLLTRKGGK